MTTKQIDKLLNSLSTSTETNSKLADVSNKALDIALMTREEKERLFHVCRQIYEALNDKTEKDVIEQVWYEGLRDVLLKK